MASCRILLLSITALFLSACSKDAPRPGEPPPCTLDETWSTVDNLEPSGGSSAAPYSLASSSTGTLYAAGTVLDSSDSDHWIIRRSVDRGRTWETVQDFQLSAGGPAQGRGLATDIAGNAFAAGLAHDGSGTRWVIRKSTNGGSSWSTAENLPGSASAAFVDLSGKLWALGTTGADEGAARRSGDAGASWASALSGTAISQFPTSMIQDFSGALFVAGYDYDTSAVWKVHRSTDGGATWTEVDSFQSAPGADARPTGLAVDRSGALYAAGSAVDGAGVSKWIVRRSTGGTWETVDTFALGSSLDSVASATGTDRAGAIYVAGAALDSSGAYRWVVRKSADAGKSWRVIDEFNLAPGASSFATSFARGPAGDLYAGGEAYDLSGDSHWVVRALNCN